MTTEPTAPITLDDATRKAVEAAELLPAQYENYEVSDTLGYKNSGSTLKEIKAQANDLDALRKTITDPLNATKKAIMDLFRPPAAALKQAESSIKEAMLAFSSEQERKRRAEEERLREEQRKEAVRLERLADEARAREAAAMAKGDESKAKKDAEKAKAFEERQTAVESNQISVAPIATPKVSGVSTRTIWTYEITDAAQIPRDYLIPDTTLINDTAKATKGKVQIPGVRIYPVKSIAAGGR